MIKLQVIGNLGKDATSNSHNGQQVINFSVAHTYKANGQDQTTWVECSYWKDNAAILQYLKKGQKVYVEGTPSVRAWESNGKQGASLSLNVFSIELCGTPPAAQPPQQQQYQQPAPQQQQYQQPAPQQQQYQQPNQWQQAPPQQGQGGLPF